MHTVMVEFMDKAADGETETLLSCGGSIKEQGIAHGRAYAIVEVEHAGRFSKCIKSKYKLARIFVCAPPDTELRALVGKN